MFLLLPLALLLVSPAHATSPAPVTFTTYSQAIYVIENRTTASGIMLFTANQSLTFTGGMTGSGVAVFSVILRPTGDYVIHAAISFTGTVNGSQPGTAEFVVAGTGSFGPYSQQGHVTLGRGTGGLEGLHGQGKYQSSDPNVTTATIPIHFDPA